jgi:hypothetical protein
MGRIIFARLSKSTQGAESVANRQVVQALDDFGSDFPGAKIAAFCGALIT